MIFRCLFVILSFAAVIRATDARVTNAELTTRTKFEGNQQNDSYADKPAFSTIRRKRGDSMNIFQFRNVALKRHNTYRTNHCVDPLKLSNELNNMAQKHANNLAGYSAKIWYVPTDVGITSYSKLFGTVSGDDVVDYWYQEIKNYNFNDPESNLGHLKDIGHFTQVIWKDTTDVGFGYAENDFSTYVVAYYKPVGNTKNDFAENVPKLQNESCRGNSAYNTQVTVSLLFGCTLLVPFIRYI